MDPYGSLYGSYMDPFIDLYMNPIWILVLIPYGSYIDPNMDLIWISIWILYGSSVDPYKDLHGSLYGSDMDPYMDPYIRKSLEFNMKTKRFATNQRISKRKPNTLQKTLKFMWKT